MASAPPRHTPSVRRSATAPVPPDSAMPPLVLRSRHPFHPGPVTDAELDTVWETLRSNRLVPVVFHDGGVRSASGLRRLLAPRRAWCYLVQAGATPLALCWLNDFSGRAARIHFCVLPSGLPRAVEIGRTVVRFLLTAPSPAGHPAPYLLDTLVGLTPAPYRHALEFVARLGFRRAAAIPGGTMLLRPSGPRVCDAVLTLCTRADVPGPA